MKTLLARSRELPCGREAVSHTHFADEGITLINHEGNQRPFAYGCLKQVMDTRNLLFLQSKARRR